MGLDTISTWSALITGKSGVDHISLFDPEPFETKIAAEVKGFDPLVYMDRKEARRADRFIQFAIAASQENAPRDPIEEIVRALCDPLIVYHSGWGRTRSPRT